MSPPPALLRLVRWGTAAIVSLSMTAGSLVVVSWMNERRAPLEQEPVVIGPPPVFIEPPPTPPRPDQIPFADAPSYEAAFASPVSSVAAPASSAPRTSGLAPTAGPGTLALGPPGGRLPSMGTLPEAKIPATETIPAEAGQTPARPRSRPKPRYPRLAQRQGLEGFVTLRLRIDATGRVVDAVVVKAEPPDVFDDAALQTARRYRFTPARRGDEAVESTLQQTIRFELQQ